MQKKIVGMTLLAIISLPSCGIEGIFSQKEDNKEYVEISESTDQKTSDVEVLKRKVVRSPERVLRRLTLDLLSRLPNEAELLEIDQNDSNLDTNKVIDKFFEQKFKISQSLGARHSEILGLNYKQNIQAIDEQFLQSNQTEESSFKIKILTEMNLFFERILFNNGKWTDVLGGNNTKIPAEISEFYDIEIIEKDLLNKTVFGQYSDLRPKLGIFALNAIYYHLISHNDDTSSERGRELAHILDCDQTRLDDTHTFLEFDTFVEQTELEQQSRSNERCAACHKIYSEYSDMSSGFKSEFNQRYEGIQFKQTKKSNGRFKGKNYQTEEEKQKAFQSHTNINLCYLQRSIATFFQRPLDSSLSESHDVINQLSIWREQSILELFKKMFKNEQYLQTVKLTDQEDNSVRFLSSSHFEGIAKDLLFTEIESQKLPGLHLGVQEQWQSNSYLPNFLYMKAVHSFVEEFAETLIQKEMISKTPSKINLFKIWQSHPSVSHSGVVEDQISYLWWRLVGEKIQTQQKKELGQIFYQSNKTLSLPESWKLVLIAVMMSAEFLTY